MNDQSPTRLSRTVPREQEMKFGTQLTSAGCRFRLWAPKAGAVSAKLYEPHRIMPMKTLERGWFEIEIEGIGHGALYKFVMQDGTEVPDPASRYQPEDVDGPSMVIDPLQFAWTDLGWRGRPWEETVIYELHVGTFTEAGTFRATIDRLDDLLELGITAIELMPLADFRGRWNWGYDGALLFAPDSTYGTPDDLKALVDAAHARGLMVFLDAVYNHFGPKGHYMSQYAPTHTEQHETPWGAAVNYDDEGSAMIRDMVMANARYWLNEYRFDGLRFDAVHAIEDNGPKHLLQDLAEQVRAATDGRHIHLMAENSANEAGWMKRHDHGVPWLYNAQWSDDLHHALHSRATRESFWYYADFHGRIDLLGRALAEGFAWQGEYMEHEKLQRGEPSGFLPPTAFISFIQNHDHTGNRPFGERIHQLASREAVRALAVVNLLSPHIPLLFMGEEWAAPQPFLYFTDVGEDLAETIRESRKEELAKMPGTNPGVTPPDPMAEETFRASKLRWEQRQQPEHADWLSLYRQLLQVRHAEIIPRLAGIEGYSGSYEVLAGHAVRVRWKLGNGSALCLVANLSDKPLDDIDVWTGTHLWLEGSADGHSLGPWAVLVCIEDGDKA